MSEFSIYPDAIDGYAQLPLVVDQVTPVDAISVNRLRCAIINIENELGVQPSGTFDTVRARLDALEDAIGDLETLVSNLDLEDKTPELSHKNPARVATSTNISLSAAPDTVDSISLAADDRILVYSQTDASKNGIYVVDTLGTGSNGVWVRANDADDETKLIPGTEIYVVEGDHASCKFWLITPGPYTLDTTSLEFVGGLGIMKSDSAPTGVLSSTAIGLGASLATPTDSLSVRGFSEIDFSFLVTDLDSITEIRVRVLYSLLESPDPYGTTPSDWNILLSEDISGGVATVDPYTISIDATTYPDLTSLPGSFAIRAPVAGLHMMMIIWSEAGTPTTSDFEGFALRRI